MCGRYVSPDEGDIEAFWRIDRRNADPFERHYNVAPTAQIPIIRQTKEGALELCQARWGLIPSWWKQEKPPTSTFNARSEEAAAKPMWRQAIRHSRCLVPALGWFEWQARERLDTRTDKPRSFKQPYFIYRDTEALIAFAGLFALRHDPSGEVLLSCAILTKSAAPSVSMIHDRMPVVLAAKDHANWLNLEQDLESVTQMMLEAQQEFTSHPVSTRINIVANDSAELIEQLDIDP